MLMQHGRLIASLFALSVKVLIVLFGRLPGDTLLWRELQNTAHVPLFGFVALATLGLVRALVPVCRDSPFIGYLVAAVASLAVGLLTEYGQLFTGREPSISDVARDLAGIITGLGIYAAIDSRMQPVWRRQGRGLRALTVTLCCLVFAFSLFPLARLATSYLQRNAAFPVIVDFRESWSRVFVECRSAVLTRLSAGEQPTPVTNRETTRLDLTPGRYPGVSVIEPYPDWRSFAYLTFVIYSLQRQPLGLVLRIHDASHDQAHSDRFNRRLEIRPGENRFRIALAEVENAPVGRHMDMSRIAGIALFSEDLSASASLYLDTLRLE